MSDTLRPHGPGQNMEWIAFPFSRGSSQPRYRTQVSRIAGGFFTSWATRGAHLQEVGSLSHSFLCTEDSAVDKNNRRGTLLDWIPKCESNGFSSLLDLPDPLLSLPLTAAPRPPDRLLLLIHSDLPGVQSISSSWRHTFQSLLSSSKLSGCPLHPGPPCHLSLSQTLCFLEPTWPFGSAPPWVLRYFPNKGYMGGDIFFRLCILVWSRYWFLHWKLFPSEFWRHHPIFLLSHFADEISYSPCIGYNLFSSLETFTILSWFSGSWDLTLMWLVVFAASALVSVQWLRRRLRSLTVWVQVQGFHSLALTSGKLHFFVPVPSSLMEMVVPTS